MEFLRPDAVGPFYFAYNFCSSANILVNMICRITFPYTCITNPCLLKSPLYMYLQEIFCVHFSGLPFSESRDLNGFVLNVSILKFYVYIHVERSTTLLGLSTFPVGKTY